MGSNGKILPIPSLRPIHRDQLVTIGDLEDFKTDLLLSLQAVLSGKNIQQTKKWIKTYEVKKLLGISSGTLQTLRNNGTIPYSKIGGILYYDADEINKLVEQKKKPHLNNWPDRR